MEVLTRAYNRENDTRDRRPPNLRSWEYYSVGATRAQINRLVEEELVVIALKTMGLTKYKLSNKGRDLVWSQSMEREFTRIPANSVLEAMELIIGFDDIKLTIAQAVENRRRTHFLLEGPPACAKSVILEGVRSAVPGAYICFGSRTSAAGLSDALFEHKPYVLLLDEADKMDGDVYAILLGLMESGEVLETKSRNTRGVRLETMVIAACNSSAKMPREFLSRFALHIHFPLYTRQEFIDVCKGFLTRAENCPPQIAILLGQSVYDYSLGDVRKARGAWQLMTAPTAEEVQRVIQMMRKYSPETQNTDQRAARRNRLPGL